MLKDQFSQLSMEDQDPFSDIEDTSELYWPRLTSLGLNSDLQLARRLAIGGSDANVILGGDAGSILSLWREKRGEKLPDDLTDRLPVMLGSWTEEFNRQWFEKISGLSVGARGVALNCRRTPWRRATVDGLVEARSGTAVWEAKHTNAFGKPEEVLQRYMPQLQHNMAVSECRRAYLSVIFGNHKFEVIEVAADWIYQRKLLRAEEAFWECVQSGESPVAIDPPPPPRPVAVRQVCLEGKNAWACAAHDWLANREGARRHAEAVTAIKSLVEVDVARAFGHGIEAKRAKNGAISIRELAQ